MLQKIYKDEMEMRKKRTHLFTSVVEIDMSTKKGWFLGCVQA